MEILIETIVSLLAILGIILVACSFFDMFRYYSIWPIKDKTSATKNKKRVEVILKLYNVSDDSKEELLNKIKLGEYSDLENLVDNIKIEEKFDNL